jgi:hypothetical protein
MFLIVDRKDSCMDTKSSKGRLAQEHDEFANHFAEAIKRPQDQPHTSTDANAGAVKPSPQGAPGSAVASAPAQPPVARPDDKALTSTSANAGSVAASPAPTQGSSAASAPAATPIKRPEDHPHTSTDANAGKVVPAADVPRKA